MSKTSNLSPERQALLQKWLSGKPEAADRIRPRVPSGEPIPAAVAQERLWFLEQFTPGTAAYHLPIAYRIEGALDLAALEHSFELLFQRHESLRTSFRSEGGRPIQIVAPPGPFSLPVTDLTGRSTEEVAATLTETYRRPFDLTSGPLYRVALFLLGEDEHLLLLTLHHLVTDGWSNTVLLRELGALYDALATGQAPNLPPPPIQFADYTLWQQRWLQGPEPERQLAYWQRQLAGAEPLLLLPTDRPRPPVHTANGAVLEFTLSGPTVAAMRALNQQEGTTLFMLVMAVFQTFLHRYTSQAEISVGMPMFNRGRPETESVVGFFANTGAIRSSFDGNPPFRALLQAVKRTTLEATSNQEVPFDRIVEALKLPRDPSHTPLIQAMLTIGAAADRDPVWHGLRLTPYPVERTAAMFDLTLELIERPDQLEFSLIYRSDLFERETISRMAANLLTLLEGIAARPDSPVSSLPLLSAAEQRQLEAWNKTAVDYPRHQTIYQVIEEQVRRQPDVIAVTAEAGQLTYGELNRRANQLARLLMKRGVTRGALVAIAMERSLEMVVGLLAILKAGAAYVPVDPSYPDERISLMLEDARPPVLLTQQTLLNRFLGRVPSLIALETEWNAVDGEVGANLDLPIGLDDLAYVIFTSGSTGRPKGAMNSHGGILNRLLWMQAEYGLTPADRVLQKTPFSFDVSVWEFFWPLMTGARLVMARPGGQKDLDYLVEAIRDEQITTLHFVPSMLHLFLQNDQVSTCASLRRVICSGEALPYELQERFFERLSCELHNLYGPTEAAVDVTYWACRQGDTRRIVPIGRPVANTQIQILDPHGNPVPIGVVGEIYIGGCQVGLGYLGRPELTVERFVTRTVLGQTIRFYRTGDLGRWLLDGVVEYLGRTDGQVKVRGVRMELGEIEAALRLHPQVKEAVVLLQRFTESDQRLIAYLVAGEEISSAELRQFLGQHLPEYMLPAAFVQLEAIPLSPNGKVDRKGLPRFEAVERRLETAPPANETERRIAEVWAEVLRLPSVGVTENLFDLGANSILVLQLCEELRKRLQLSLSVVDLFRFTTVRRLAEFIDQRTPGAETRTQTILDRAARQRAALMNQRRDQRTGGR